ncbi:uncharacterized protein LOC122810897 isoform X2 [Protopterus annectens]|uniref:uncharacterized protein LOC122810897 isoform X2 n=1 Tax=Protopterus annectens TaxID=7888 RepID=UPI001CFAE411|nr:uncharacterized protein LOC122810897 isoform X2 [Protopterus annectens]
MIWKCTGCVFALASGILALTVYQDPSVSATVGEDVLLPCYYTPAAPGPPNVGQYKWWFSVSGVVHEVTNTTPWLIGRVDRVTHKEFMNDRNASIRIHRVNTSDSGMYYCHVELFSNGSQNGTGTYLHVLMPQDLKDLPKPGTRFHKWHIILIVLACLFLILGIIAIILLLHHRTTPRERMALKTRTSAAAAAAAEAEERRHEDLEYALLYFNKGKRKPKTEETSVVYASVLTKR